MPTLTDVFAVAPDVVTRESDAEMVVVLPESGKFFVLNGTGAETFRLLDGARALSDVVTALHARYPDAAQETIEQDVLRLVEKLIERDAVQKATV